MRRIVEDQHTRRLGQNGPSFIGRKFLFCLNIDRFRMPHIDRDSHRGRGHLNGPIAHDLSSLIEQLHFFLRVPIGKKIVDLRETIKRNLVRVDLRRRLFEAEQVLAFRHQLVHGFLAGPGDRLERGHDDPPDLCTVMQRLQRDDHLDGRAVGIGDDALMIRNVVRIYFGNHQRHIRFHPPGCTVVDHHGAGLGRDRRKFPADIRTG